MLKELDYYDWEESFKYAEPSAWKDCEVDAFTRDDVELLYGIDEGENDGPSWMCCGLLKDGRYFYLEAGCDYTGWG